MPCVSYGKVPSAIVAERVLRALARSTVGAAAGTYSCCATTSCAAAAGVAL